MNYLFDPKEYPDRFQTPIGKAPTTSITASLLDHCFSIPEADIIALTSAGAIAFTPDVDISGDPTPRVDLMDAARAWMLFNRGKMESGDHSKIFQRILDRSADTCNMTYRLGWFTTSIARSRISWKFTLSPLPGFDANLFSINYGVACTRYMEWAKGVSPM